MYRHDGSEESVRPPHTRIPRVPNGRMQLTPIGLSRSCSPLVTLDSRSRAPRMTSFAGAFQTPRVSSFRAQMPEMWPDGGTVTMPPLRLAGFATLIQG